MRNFLAVLSSCKKGAKKVPRELPHIIELRCAVGTVYVDLTLGIWRLKC
jgi:hypothetical protein